jgi:hypothetical protein
MRQFHPFSEKKKDLPSDIYWLAIEDINNERMRHIKQAKKLSSKMLKLQKEYMEKLYALIGDKYLKQYLSLHEKRKKVIPEAKKQCPPTIEGLKKLEELRNSNIENSKKIIERSNVNIKAIENLQKVYGRKFRRLQRGDLQKHIYHPLSTKRPRADRHYFERFRPPYDYGENVEPVYCDYSDGCDIASYQWYSEYPEWGYVGSKTSIQCREASNLEWSWIWTFSYTQSICQVKRTGELIVWAFLRPDLSNHEGFVKQDCVGSSVRVTQEVNVYVSVLRLGSAVPDYQYVPFPDPNGDPFEVTDPYDGEFHWDHDRFNDPTEKVDTGNIVFPGPYQRGDWIVLKLGIRNANSFRSNDYFVGSYNTQQFEVVEKNVYWAG